MTAAEQSTKGMTLIPAGSFLMGSEEFYPEERPGPRGGRRRVLDGRASGDRRGVPPIRQGDRLRDARRAPARPGRLPGRRPGSCSCPARWSSTGPPGRCPLDDYRNWWSYVPGASWRHPKGPASTLDGRDRHPVTQVAFEDVAAYAAWAGKELPTEAEWEYAARGGLEGKTFAWGDEFAPRGRMMANTWQGEFPWQNTARGRVRGHVAGRRVPAQRLRPVRHGRQRLGVDRRLLCAAPRRRRRATPCCGPIAIHG